MSSVGTCSVRLLVRTADRRNEMMAPMGDAPAIEKSVTDLDIARQLAWLESMRIAIDRAIAQHRRLGQPIAVLRDGRVVKLEAGEY